MMQIAKAVDRATAPLSAASDRIDAAVHTLADYVKLEAIVTGVCLFIPLLLFAGADGTFLPSISAYYGMERAQYFFVPLTMAGMLFIVNGVVKRAHWYNVWLGVSLLVLTFFNHVDHHLIHLTAAAAFFVGNGIVFVVFSPKKELWFKAALAAIMGAALLGHYGLGWYSLFFAEAFSLWVIAAHFFLETLGLIG